MTTYGLVSTVEFPINISEVIVEGEETYTEYVAENVYSFKTVTTPNLKERIEASYAEWLEKAKTPEPQETTIEDLVEIIDALTDIIIGE